MRRIVRYALLQLRFLSQKAIPLCVRNGFPRWKWKFRTLRKKTNYFFDALIRGTPHVRLIQFTLVVRQFHSLKYETKIIECNGSFEARCFLRGLQTGEQDCGLSVTIEDPFVSKTFRTPKEIFEYLQTRLETISNSALLDLKTENLKKHYGKITLTIQPESDLFSISGSPNEISEFG